MAPSRSDRLSLWILFLSRRLLSWAALARFNKHDVAGAGSVLHGLAFAGHAAAVGGAVPDRARSAGNAGVVARALLGCGVSARRRSSADRAACRPCNARHGFH